MTRTERKRAKKRSTLYSWLGISSFILFIFVGVMYISIDDMNIFLTNLLHTPKEGIHILIILTTTFIPGVTSMIFFILSGRYSQTLYIERRMLDLKRDTIRVRHFWLTIKNDDLNKAYKLYNSIIDKDNKIIANGIIIGVSTQKNIDQIWDMNINKYIDNYLLSYPE